ncbi:MAG: restriction endonuclease [Alphaproteobacteria bacterium]|nr:restriction endonuclease [Alphaproteobacteria bacterium]
MMRAGREGRLLDEFLTRGLVAIGWPRIGDPTGVATEAALLDLFRLHYAEWTETQCAVAAGQVYRFVHEFRTGDQVVLYDSAERLYRIGRIAGMPRWAPGDEEMSCTRAVEWTESLARDSLSPDSRTILTAYQALFLLPDYSCIEIESRLAGRSPPEATPLGAFDPYLALEERAHERLKDRLLRLSWTDMQELVAALLRALGYRTTVSPLGPDRGKDVVASPDGLGLESPRIVAEVKHRPGFAIGAADIRSFIGGRRRDERGLFVSTGGFTKDAVYEAERADMPLRLMTLDDLARAVTAHYDRFDVEGRLLLPLSRIYWVP